MCNLCEAKAEPGEETIQQARNRINEADPILGIKDFCNLFSITHNVYHQYLRLLLAIYPSTIMSEKVFTIIRGQG